MATKNYCNLEDLTVYDEEIKSYIGSHGGQTYTVNTLSGLAMSNNQISINLVPMSKGGTGARNSTDARYNLGAAGWAVGTESQGEPISSEWGNTNDIWYEKYE